MFEIVNSGIQSCQIVSPLLVPCNNALTSKKPIKCPAVKLAVNIAFVGFAHVSK